MPDGRCPKCVEVANRHKRPANVVSARDRALAKHPRSSAVAKKTAVQKPARHLRTRRHCRSTFRSGHRSRGGTSGAGHRRTQGQRVSGVCQEDLVSEVVPRVEGRLNRRYSRARHRVVAFMVLIDKTWGARNDVWSSEPRTHSSVQALEKAEWSAGLDTHFARHRLSDFSVLEIGVATTRNGRAVCKHNNACELQLDSLENFWIPEKTQGRNSQSIRASRPC